MKKWEIKNSIKSKKQTIDAEELLDLLLENRGIKTKKDRQTFLHPKLADVTIDAVGIDKKQLQKAIKRINKAIENKEHIIIYGDYDVDGITATSILWETLHDMHANVMPYIPNRIDEGYGLSEKGIENLLSKKDTPTLIITVDNGIVAHEAVAFANKNSIDIIITDHHTTADTLPAAYAIVHTTNLCGAGIAYLFSKELNKLVIPDSDRGSRTVTSLRGTDSYDAHLELATLGTIADLVPLTGANRAIVKFGLEKLSQTKRPGLQELYRLAGLYKEGERNLALGVYEIGYIIAPRLNAAGRLESAMDSLRLLCTKDWKRAQTLALQLEGINRERQDLTKGATEHAVGGIRELVEMKKLLFIGHETYREGVIGLIAGRLVEEFYRPSIVLSIGATHSKGSARSISGFNLIEFLRIHKDHFISLGGHPMAAGFTIETSKMPVLQQLLQDAADTMIEEATLQRTLRIDCELPLEMVTQNIYETLQQLSPFGMANPEPVFASKKVVIKELKVLGKDKKHLKLQLASPKSQSFNAIAFGMAANAESLKSGDKIDVAYTIDENRWNGNVKLQLKIKDLQT